MSAHWPGAVETTYGNGDLAKYADRIGVVYKTLLNYERVGAAYATTTSGN